MSVGIARIADGEPKERKRRDGRALLLNGARQLLAEKGYAGMELRDVAERGKRAARLDLPPLPRRQGAARPRGRRARRDDDPRPDRTLAGGARPEADARRSSATIFRRRVADHPERIGCPVAAAALARPEDPELAAVATAAFQSWERPIAAALRDEGVDAGRRRGLRRPRRLDRRGRPAARPRRRQPGAARLGDRWPRAGAGRAARGLAGVALDV